MQFRQSVLYKLMTGFRTVWYGLTQAPLGSPGDCVKYFVFMMTADHKLYE
jgi:hypothetical protein